MASGDTITGSLKDSLDSVVASARQVREYEGVVPQLVDKHTLAKGTGLDWKEVDIAQLVAQNVQETTNLDNPQQLSDTAITITPTVVGLQTFITDRVALRMNQKAFAKLGGLAQNAMQRRKDEDGLTQIDAATTSLAGAGVTLLSGHIVAAVARISSNATESGPKPIRCVLHGFHIKALFDELVAGVGTYTMEEGPTARVFQEGFKLPIAGAEVYEDGNITIDSSDDAKGGVFSQMGIILVQGFMPRAETRREPQKGGGGTSVFHYDEYAYGERSSGNWVYEILADATTPTS